MILGVVRLAPGRAAFYDDLTNIHLTAARPEANVYQGMNTAKLKRGVAYGTIRLVSGTLELVETQPVGAYYVPPVMPQEAVEPVSVSNLAPDLALNEEPKLVPVEEPKANKTKSKKEK